MAQQELNWQPHTQKRRPVPKGTVVAFRCRAETRAFAETIRQPAEEVCWLKDGSPGEVVEFAVIEVEQ